jgi:4-carboxymuconolactone decarboxylase
MPPLAPAAMNDEQRKAAGALAAGPRGAVKGPFVALLRSPELMDRLQQVGEYLRFRTALAPRVSELLMPRRARLDAAVRMGGSRAARDESGRQAGDGG